MKKMRTTLRTPLHLATSRKSTGTSAPKGTESSRTPSRTEVTKSHRHCLQTRTTYRPPKPAVRSRCLGTAKDSIARASAYCCHHTPQHDHSVTLHCTNTPTLVQTLRQSEQYWLWLDWWLINTTEIISAAAAGKALLALLQSAGCGGGGSEGERAKSSPAPTRSSSAAGHPADGQNASCLGNDTATACMATLICIVRGCGWMHFSLSGQAKVCVVNYGNWRLEILCRP